MRVTMNSIARVRSTMLAMRLVWKRPWAYCTTRFFKDRALPT